MIGATLLFGSIGIFVRAIPLASSVIALARAVVGSLVLLAAALLRRRPVDAAAVRRALPLLIFSGACIGVNWILLFEAYRYTSVGVATLAYYAAPVLVLLLSPLVLRERLTLARGLGVALAAGGTLLLTGGSAGAGSDPLRGILLGLGAAAFYAAVVLTNKFITGLDGLPRTLIQLAAAGAVLAPYVLLTRPAPTGPMTAAAFACLAAVCLVHTGFGYWLYFSAMGELSGQTTALLGYLDPLSALVFAALFLGERMGALQLAGAALILGGAALGELWQGRKTSGGAA